MVLLQSIIGLMTGRIPYSATRELLNSKGCGRRSFFKVLGEWIDAGISLPSVLLASEDKRLIIPKILEYEKKYNMFLDIPDFDLEKTVDGCNRICKEITRGISETETLGIQNIKKRKQKVKEDFLKKNRRLGRYFKLTDNNHSDKKFISHALKQGALDCDLMTYFHFDAGHFSGEPIYGVRLVRHLLPRYQDSQLTVNFETTAKNTKEIEKIIKRSSVKRRLMEIMGLDPDNPDIHDQLRFPEQKTLVKFWNQLKKEDIVDQDSIRYGIFTHSQDYDALLAEIKSRIGLSIAKDAPYKKRSEQTIIARQLANESIAASPRNFRGYVIRGWCDFIEQDFDSALRNYKEGLERFPSSKYIKKLIEQVEEIKN